MNEVLFHAFNEEIEKIGATRATRLLLKGKLSPYYAQLAGVSAGAHRKGRAVSQLVSQWKRSGRGKDTQRFQAAKALVDSARVRADLTRRLRTNVAEFTAKLDGAGPSSKLRKARHKQHKRLWKAKERGAHIPWRGPESITPFSRRDVSRYTPSSGKGRFLKVQQALRSGIK